MYQFLKLLTLETHSPMTPNKFYEISPIRPLENNQLNCKVYLSFESVILKQTSLIRLGGTVLTSNSKNVEKRIIYTFAALKLQRNYPGIYYQSEPHPYLCLKARDTAPRFCYRLHSKH